MILGALGFVVATAFWPGLLSTAVAPRWAALAILPPLLCRLDLGAVRPAFALGLGLWVGYAGLSIGWAPDQLTAGHEFIHLLLLASIGLMAAGIEDIAPILSGFSIGIAVSGLMTVPQFFGWSPVDQLIGPAGLFLNRALLGEIAAPVFVWCLLSRRWALLPPLAIPLVLCESRVALVALVVALLAVLPRRVVWLAGGVAIYAAVAWLAGVLPFDPGKLASASQRLDIWRDAVTGLTPLGNGIGSFTALYPRWEYVHSDILQTVYELGIGALAPLVCGVMALAAKGRREDRGALVASLVVAVLSFPLHTPAAAFLGFVLAGHLAGWRPMLRSLEYGGGVAAARAA